MMLDTVTHQTVQPEPVFVVTANGTLTPFCIDDDAFAGWLAAAGDDVKRNRLARSIEAPGQALSELAHSALSAAVLVSDPDIELNTHGCVADETGCVVRLNNRSGHQQLVGLAGGWHELRWPPNNLTTNTLLNDLQATDLPFDGIHSLSGKH